jgi:hypothetical protein
MFMLMLALILPFPYNPAMGVYPYDPPTLVEEEGKRNGSENIHKHVRKKGKLSSNIGRVRVYVMHVPTHMEKMAHMAKHLSRAHVTLYFRWFYLNVN